MMPRRLFLPVLLFALAGPAVAQEARPLVVMNLAAHPDDEDGRTLTYYRYAKDAIAYSVIFTRGEGGQNEIGPELYEALGAIRTQETEQAARILGTEVYFLNFKDFGYSKRAEEAFDLWGGRDLVTSRLVYLIRKLKPDVLFTNHDTLTVGSRLQHGQHQAVGIAGYDAMTLANDPAYHPEHLEEEGVDLWEPKRLFLRHWSRPDDGTHDVSVPVGDLYESAGMSYAELAATALQEHASQGMGLFAGRFRTDSTYFSLLHTNVDAPPSPYDLAAGLPANEAAAPDLSYWIDSGRVPGLPAEAFTVSDSIAVPGQQITLRWQRDRLPEAPIQWAFSGAIDTTLHLSDETPGIAALRIAPTARPTVPYEGYQYDRFVNHPPVRYAVYRNGSRELLAAGYLPLQIAPALLTDAEADVVRLRPGSNPLPVWVHAYDPAVRHVELNVALARAEDRTVIYQDLTTLEVEAPGTVRDTLALNLPPAFREGTYEIILTALPREATHRAVPTRANVPARAFTTSVPEGLRVGLVESYDNTLATALGELGVSYRMLDSLALSRSAFEGLHTIVVDIRAYLVRQDLRMYNDRLLDWVHAGGHLIVNYQKTFEWNEGSPDPFDPSVEHTGSFAPYPLELSRDRVTREDAPVTVLTPDHPLFNVPNALGPSTWDGWVQERGLYFPGTYDDRYIPLLQMQDPGEDPLQSSTLLAKYGDGTYLYTALGWYRQLKEYHPGAYAAFANMISLPLVDGRSAPASTH